VLKSWLNPAPPSVERITDPRQRRFAVAEIVIVFAITLGLSGFRSLVSLLDSLLRTQPLDKQHVALNVPQATHSFLDLLGQLAGVVQLLGWAALALYLLWRNGILPRMIGLARRPQGTDWLRGVGLTALIGIPGLALYLGARAIGANLDVAPSTLDDTWWRIPVLVLSAIGNACAEEVLVVGYLLTMLRRLGWRENSSLLVAAVLRGSYHLYQGFGGFVGNVVMGLVFGRVWQRTNRLYPLIIAHTLLDVISFVGYALLAGKLSFLR
jgi:hypothetical protein